MTVWELRAVCRSWLDGLEAHWRRLGKRPVVCPTQELQDGDWKRYLVSKVAALKVSSGTRSPMSSFPWRGNNDPERSNSLVSTDVGEGTFC